MMKFMSSLPPEVQHVLRELGEKLGTSRRSKARYQRAAMKALGKPRRRKLQKAQRRDRKRNRG